MARSPGPFASSTSALPTRSAAPETLQLARPTKDRANFSVARTRTASLVREYHQLSLLPSAIDRFNSFHLALSPGHPSPADPK